MQRLKKMVVNDRFSIFDQISIFDFNSTGKSENKTIVDDKRWLNITHVRVESIRRHKKKNHSKYEMYRFGRRKQWGKRRKCWLPAFSPFLTSFSEAWFIKDFKRRHCVFKYQIARYITCISPYNRQNTNLCNLISKILHTKISPYRKCRFKIRLR